jgi:aerobic carbon-monoxide dehydrogenase medium subunit
MKAAAFDYHAPDTIDEVIGLLAELDDAKVVAGGQSLVPLLAMRLASFSHLVDLHKVESLRGIERRNGSLWLGACTTQATIERDAAVARTVPLLARAVPLIGHFQIRNRGTVGGSLAHADPAAELPAVALALDARIEAASPSGSREIPAAEFFTGFWATALDDHEVLTGVRFPVWEGRCGFAVEELARRHGDFAIAGACVALQLDERDVVQRCSIALLGLGPTPERAGAAEQSVVGAGASDVDATALGRAAVGDLTAIPSDLHGPAEYRRRVGAIVVARAWTRAIEEALHG